MQKVVGSNPISRLMRGLANAASRLLSPRGAGVRNVVALMQSNQAEGALERRGEPEPADELGTLIGGFDPSRDWLGRQVEMQEHR